jgi:molybdenum cofactor cytidylyltransferase
MSPEPVGIVPAAGRGTRFGGAKMLALVRGEPMLAHPIRALLDGGIASVIVVITPALAEAGAIAELDRPGVTVVFNPDPDRGMFSSIQIGIDAADGDPIVVLPGDMPYVQSATVTRLLAEFAHAPGAVAPQFQGKHGHPLALPGRARRAILQAEATARLDDVLATSGFPRRFFDVDDAGVTRDVDVIGDLR